MKTIKLIFFTLGLVFAFKGYSYPKQNDDKPNILWITCEDISPYLGCYGSKEAFTPNIDKLSEIGIRFTHAYANAPVCAVARSTILSGMYASTLGTHQMRSRPLLPPDIPVYPKILREAGYYCTNNSKTDYNSNLEKEKKQIWNDTGSKAHWKNRPVGKPFFSVFNITITHESQLSTENIKKYLERGQIPKKTRINPGDIVLPPYHPDLPEIRQDWARLHDLITLMDSEVGNRLKEIKDAGLADNTIVFFYSDHGGQLARAKRFIYNVGTQVPLIVHLPKKWQHISKQKPGKTSDELVSFIDFPKTLLSIANCEVPDKMQGTVFLGNKKEISPDYVHFFRDRMAERYDFSRAVTDGKYYFIRNFMPHRPRGRDSRYGYMVQANWRAWEEHYEAGKCNDIQSQFYLPKPAIEFFNTDKDPWQVSNLVNEKQEQERIKKLSHELDRWMIETRDIGLIPEPMFCDLIGSDKKHGTLYEYAQSEDYPITKILEVAKIASEGDMKKQSIYTRYMTDGNPVIRFWGAYGIFLARSKNSDLLNALKKMMQNDEFAANRIMAAQAIGISGKPDLALSSLKKEINETKDGYVFLFALNALQYSHTDQLLTREDWTRFDEKKFPDGVEFDHFGVDYAQRIITDALELWPERRNVD